MHVSLSSTWDSRSLQNKSSWFIRLMYFSSSCKCIKLLFYYREPWQGGRKIHIHSLLLTTEKRKQWGGLYPADPKGRRLAPCDFVCKATQTPRAGAWQRTTARTQGLSLTKGSRIAVSETLVYLFSYSLPNQYQKQQKRRREEDTKKHTQKQTNACSVGGEN